MPDNTTDAPPFSSFKVKRFDVELTTIPTQIKRSKERKGEWYPGVKVEESNVDEVAKWLGKEVLVSLFKGKINQRFQALYDEASTQEDGKTPKPFDQDEFIALAESFSARGETISDINNEISDLNEELANLDWTNPVAAGTDAQRISLRIKSLIIARESKRRNKETEAEVVAGS